MNVSQLSIVLNAGQVLAGIKNIQNQLGGLGGSVNKANAQLGGIGKGFKAMGGIGMAAVGGIAAGIAAVGFGALIGGVISANAEFSKMEAQLNLMTGSAEETTKVMGAISALSGKLGVPADEMTEAFIRVRNLGLDPSARAMEAYANVAAGSGKTIMQFSEAVADAATGEFERLKEFGIKARAEGDQVAMTFQGTTTSIGNNSKDIEKYLQSIGQVQFAGAAEAQAKSLGGQITQMQGNIKAAALAFGKSGFNEGVAEIIGLFNDALKASGPFLEAMGKFGGKILKDVASMIRQVAKGIQDFMGQGSDMGGVFVTNGQKIMAVFQTIGQVVGIVFNFLKDTVITWVTNTIGYMMEIYKTFKGVFDFIGKLAFSVFNHIANIGISAFKAIFVTISRMPKIAMEALKIVKGLFTGIGKAAQALLRGDFAGIGAAFTGSFDTGAIRAEIAAVDGALRGLGSSVGDVFTTPLGEASGYVADMGNMFNRNARDLATRPPGAADAGPDMDSMGRQAIETETPAPTGETASQKRDREKREDERKKAMDKLKGEMDNLISTYAPLIERAREYSAAQKTMADIAKLSTTELAAMGMTMEQVALIRDRMEADFAKPMGQLDLEDLQFEAVQLARGTDAASVAAGEFADYMREAGLSYQDINPAIAEQIRQQMLSNELLAREVDMKEDLKDYQTSVQTELRLMGLVGKERERQVQLIDAENEARKRGYADVPAYVAAIRRGMDLLDEEREKFNTFGFGLRKVVTEYSEAVRDVASQTENAVSNIVGSLEDTLTDFFKTGKLNWRDFMSDIAEEMARFAAKNAVMQFMKLFSGMGGGGLGGIGGFISGMFGGMRENGGPVTAGKSYIVGEKRPEVFTPGTSGYIHPEVRASGAGGTSISVTMPAMSLSISGDGTNFDYNRLDQMMTDLGNETLNKAVQHFQDELRHGGTLR